MLSIKLQTPYKSTIYIKKSPVLNSHYSGSACVYGLCCKGFVLFGVLERTPARTTPTNMSSQGTVGEGTGARMLAL